MTQAIALYIPTTRVLRSKRGYSTLSRVHRHFAVQAFDSVVAVWSGYFEDNANKRGS
jgi:hypothetical protein